MPRPIQDMAVVITGASAGIGRALAVELSRRGANLTLAARRLDRLEALNRELGGRHLCVQTDVAQEAQCFALIEQAHRRFGRIDVLACNAGYGINRDVAEMTAQEYRDIVATNFYGTTDCIRAAVPLMKAQEPRAGWRGQVLIVSSCLARRGAKQYGAYSATKAAQLSVSEAMRVELKPDRIAVTSVHPIGTETEFSAVARERSGRGSNRSSFEPRQSAEHVARRMVKAIVRPRPEVWTHPLSHFVFSLMTLCPRLGDWFMNRRGR